MPPKRPRSRPVSRQSSALNASLASGDAGALAIAAAESLQKSGRWRQSSMRDSQTTLTSAGETADKAPLDEADLQQEVIRQLSYGLGDCSRQRLRAVRMGLRKTANGESRISAKELYSLLQEKQVRVGARAWQLVRELYEDANGVHYGKLWTALEAAHDKSGRDSVAAQHRRGDLELDSSMAHVTQEERDKDLVSRLAQQMLKHREAFDLEELQSEFQEKDVNKGGKLERNQMMEVMFACTMPVYGALLHAVLNRCDDEHSGQCSWPEMMSLLGRAKAQLLENGALTAEQWVRLKARRAEEKQAAIDRAREQEERRLAILNGDFGDNKKPAAKEKLSETANKESAFKKAVGEATENGIATDAEKLNKSFKGGPGFLKSMKGLLKGNQGAKSDEEKSKSVADRFKALGKPKAKTLMKSMVAIENARQQQQTTKRLTPTPPSEETAKSPVPSQGQSLDNKENELAPSPRVPRNQPLNAVTPTPHGHIYVNAGRMDVNVRGRNLTFYTPPDFNPDVHSTDPPNQRLQMAWVYGYNGHDSRNNIHVLASGEILYFTGTVVVMYNSAVHSQRHYREHTACVKSIAVHPNGVTVASGQQSGRQAEAHVRLWRSDTLTTLHLLGMHAMAGAVLAVAFSSTQERLFAVDDRNDHVICTWDVNSGQLLAQAPSGVDYVCGLCVQTTDPTVVVLAGREHLGWWRLLPEQRTFELFRKADYQNYLRARYVTCLWRNEKDDTLAGDSNGTVYVWGQGRNVITNLIKHAHQGSVLCIEVIRGHVLTGGRDGCIHSWLWSKQMPNCATLSLPESEGGVRALAIHKDMLLIGTTCNSIITATLAGKAVRNPLAGVTLNRALLTHGHYGEVRGVHMIPSPIGLALSTGADGLLCFYSTGQRRPDARIALPDMVVTCSDLNVERTLLALATKSGQVCVYCIEYEENGGKIVKEFARIDTSLKKGTAKVISMSPDGAYVAVGGTTGTLLVLGQQPDEDGHLRWDVLASCHGHKEAVTAIDWSLKKTESGGYTLRSCDKALRYMLWRSSDLCSLNLPEVGSIGWSSLSFKLAFDTIGVYFCKQAEKAIVTSLDVDAARSLILMGDSHGYLSLFKYPCSKKGGDCIQYRHHSRVSHVCFLGTLPCTCVASQPTPTPWREPRLTQTPIPPIKNQSNGKPKTMNSVASRSDSAIQYTPFIQKHTASPNSLAFLRGIMNASTNFKAKGALKANMSRSAKSIQLKHRSEPLPALSSQSTPIKREKSAIKSISKSRVSSSTDVSNRCSASTQRSNRYSASTQNTNNNASSNQGSHRSSARTPESNRSSASSQESNRSFASTRGSNSSSASTQESDRRFVNTRGSKSSSASTQGSNTSSASTQSSNKSSASTQGSNNSLISNQGSNSSSASTQRSRTGTASKQDSNSSSASDRVRSNLDSRANSSPEIINRQDDDGCREDTLSMSAELGSLLDEDMTIADDKPCDVSRFLSRYSARSKLSGDDNNNEPTFVETNDVNDTTHDENSLENNETTGNKLSPSENKNDVDHASCDNTQYFTEGVNDEESDVEDTEEKPFDVSEHVCDGFHEYALSAGRASDKSVILWQVYEDKALNIAEVYSHTYRSSGQSISKSVFSRAGDSVLTTCNDQYPLSQWTVV